jgi:hypothetical protein
MSILSATLVFGDYPNTCLSSHSDKFLLIFSAACALVVAGFAIRPHKPFEKAHFSAPSTQIHSSAPECGIDSSICGA